MVARLGTGGLLYVGVSDVCIEQFERHNGVFASTSLKGTDPEEWQKSSQSRL